MGDDIVRGGGSQDRLVLRIDILDKMYEDWVARMKYVNEAFGFRCTPVSSPTKRL
ncbi:MAG: hypothetical protein WCC66_08500 [Rhizobiaceae bacterium]